MADEEKTDFVYDKLTAQRRTPFYSFDEINVKMIGEFVLLMRDAQVLVERERYVNAQYARGFYASINGVWGCMHAWIVLDKRRNMEARIRAIKEEIKALERAQDFSKTMLHLPEETLDEMIQIRKDMEILLEESGLLKSIAHLNFDEQKRNTFIR